MISIWITILSDERMIVMADINLEDLLKGHQAQAGTEDNKALMEAPEAVAEKVTHQV